MQSSFLSLSHDDEREKEEDNKKDALKGTNKQDQKCKNLFYNIICSSKKQKQVDKKEPIRCLYHHR